MLNIYFLKYMELLRVMFLKYLNFCIIVFYFFVKIKMWMRVINLLLFNGVFLIVEDSGWFL